MDREHYKSGRFIHDELLRRAAKAVDKIPDLWRRDKAIYPSILLWPEDSVRTTTREEFTGVVFSELPSEEESGMPRRKYIERAAGVIGAYAVLVTEELADCVRCIFESRHGTESWRLPIKHHGDVRVLGAAVRRSNTESVGVLWHAN